MEDDDIVKEFLVESHENLDQLDQLLVELEENPTSRERLASIFRTIHTIKGTSGFLAFARLEAIAHAGESLLSKLRDGVLELDQARTDALLAMVDAIRRILKSIESTGKESDEDPASLVTRLTELTDGAPTPKAVAPVMAAVAPIVAAAPAPVVASAPVAVPTSPRTSPTTRPSASPRRSRASVSTSSFSID